MVLVIITSGKALGTGPGCELFLIDISYYYHFYYHFYYHTTKPQATRSHVRVKSKSTGNEVDLPRGAKTREHVAPEGGR